MFCCLQKQNKVPLLAKPYEISKILGKGGRGTPKAGDQVHGWGNWKDCELADAGALSVRSFPQLVYAVVSL